MKLDIINLAQEAEIVVIDKYYVLTEMPCLERFAALVIEECAKVCDEYADDPVYCGNAIRDMKEP